MQEGSSKVDIVRSIDKYSKIIMLKYWCELHFCKLNITIIVKYHVTCYIGLTRKFESDSNK